MKFFIFALLLNFTLVAKALPAQPISDRPLILIGSLKGYYYPGLEDKISLTWNFIKARTGLDQQNIQVKAPVINFEPFVFSKETPSWVQFQKQWIKDHSEIWDDWNKLSDGAQPEEEGNPFPKNFTAFEYYGTSHIQVNPEFSFFPYYKYDNQGLEQDLVGLGYYSVGHELYHYALSLMNVPIKLHHCIFVQDNTKTDNNLVSDLSEFLIDHQISSFLAKAQGSDAEILINPCKDLSSEEHSAALTWAKKLNP